MNDKFKIYCVKDPDQYLTNKKWDQVVLSVVMALIFFVITIYNPYVGIPLIIILIYSFVRTWRQGFNDEIKCIRINFNTGVFEIVVANDERIDGNLFDYKLKYTSHAYYLYDPTDRKKFYIRSALQGYAELIRRLEVFYYRNKRRLRH